MEKQGMDRGNRIFRPGLLISIIAAVFFFVSFIFGTGAEEDDFQVTTSLSPENPLVSENFTLTILADHPNPSEIRIQPPPFPPGLMVERIRSEARNIQNPANEPGDQPSSSRWTAIEYLFVAHLPLNFELGPFEVNGPDKSALTETMQLIVSDGGRRERRYDPAFHWENPPSALEAGKESSLVLALNNWDPGFAPPDKFYGGRGPKNAIMEELPPAGPGGDGIIRYAFKIIPLALSVDANNRTLLELEAFSFSHEEYLLEIPRLSLRLIDTGIVSETPPPVSAANFQAEPLPPDTAEITDTKPAFAGSAENIVLLLQKEYDRVEEKTKGLWEAGFYAQALAELRRNERDSPAGPYFTPFRRELEKNLGLAPVEDESWQFWKKPVFFLVLTLVFLAILSGFRKKTVTSADPKGYKGVIFSVAAGILALLIFLGGAKIGNSGGSRQKAVVVNTPAYRVPDEQGTVSAQFAEGELVYLRSARGAWVYAESAGAYPNAGTETGVKSGWIPSETAILY